MKHFMDLETLTTAQISHLLSIDRRTVWQRCKADRIPHDSTGKKLRFSFNRELRAALRASGVQLFKVHDFRFFLSEDSSRRHGQVPMKVSAANLGWFAIPAASNACSSWSLAFSVS